MAPRPGWLQLFEPQGIDRDSVVLPDCRDSAALVDEAPEEVNRFRACPFTSSRPLPYLLCRDGLQALPTVELDIREVRRCFQAMPDLACLNLALWECLQAIAKQKVKHEHVVRRWAFDEHTTRLPTNQAHMNDFAGRH